MRPLEEVLAEQGKKEHTFNADQGICIPQALLLSAVAFLVNFAGSSIIASEAFINPSPITVLALASKVYVENRPVGQLRAPTHLLLINVSSLACP